MARKKGHRLSAKERERRAQEVIADGRRWLDVESRLNDWQRFFRSVMQPYLDSSDPSCDPYGALKSDAPQIAQVARDAVVSVTQAEACVTANNIRGVVVSLLDVAFSACRMFYLDSEGDANIRDKAREILKLGRESRTPKAQQLAAMIRDEVATIQNNCPVPMTSTSARQALSRKAVFADGTTMVSLRTINAAFGRKRRLKKQ